VKNVAVFDSGAFNHTEPRDYFLNPCCFGDDLARRLMTGFVQLGLSVDQDPGQEDFGWYFRYRVGDQDHCLVISGNGEGEWYVVVERERGLFASLFGRRHTAVAPAAVDALRAALASEESVRNLRWLSWKEFRSGSALPD